MDVLRTVYLSHELDEELRKRAFAEKKSKGEIIRNIVQNALLAKTFTEKCECGRPLCATARCSVCGNDE